MKKGSLLLGGIALMILACLGCEKNPVSISLKSVKEFSTEKRPISILFENQSGLVFVVNSNPARQNNSYKIQCFDRQGNYQKTIVDFTDKPGGAYARYEPIDMAMDSDRILHVLVKPYSQLMDGSWVPCQGFCILRFQIDGRFIGEFDFAQFEAQLPPAAIACYQGYVYVTNGLQLMKIDKDNGLHFEIPLPTEQDSSLRLVSDMSIDSKGSVWLVGQASFPDSTVGCHLTRISLMENSLIKYYSKGRTNDFGSMVNNPGIAIDREDRIYLATFYCRTLEVFNRDGKFLDQIELDHAAGSLPIDVAVDQQGDVFVADYGANRVVILKKS
ncbi:MAG: hypothetical protein ONB13_06000 [candidate division KSB1 bacterium]|nr:hypothetical protein [candidate division KSB1 bacterium]MDZ7334513.1 hypothetical protein [candidate division KSB1 bacterium]MDZ7359003.1 hypothetical protein [candidate division KSB1 bacterium]MDZ7376154.1 hypothetical protein [candidate division KSB1 bacterium]MDZ7400978.1 hypothetical protein [candidate division KSB1 bacterium]